MVEQQNQEIYGQLAECGVSVCARRIAYRRNGGAGVQHQRGGGRVIGHDSVPALGARWRRLSLTPVTRWGCMPPSSAVST